MTVKIHAIRDLPKRKEPLILCRKIRYGRNGNFVRYAPIVIPKGARITMKMLVDYLTDPNNSTRPSGGK